MAGIDSLTILGSMMKAADGVFNSMQQKKDAKSIESQNRSVFEDALRRGNQQAASARAQRGASGVAVGSGSALRSAGRDARDAGQSAVMANIEGLYRAHQAKQAASDAMLGGFSDAGSSLLAGLLKQRQSSASTPKPATGGGQWRIIR